MFDAIKRMLVEKKMKALIAAIKDEDLFKLFEFSGDTMRNTLAQQGIAATEIVKLIQSKKYEKLVDTVLFRGFNIVNEALKAKNNLVSPLGKEFIEEVSAIIRSNMEIDELATRPKANAFNEYCQQRQQEFAQIWENTL